MPSSTRSTRSTPSASGWRRTGAPRGGASARSCGPPTRPRAAGGAFEPELDRPHATVRDDGGGTLPSTRRTWLDADGRIVQELIEVEGLGHAWSGGAAGGSHTDPRGPSAADAIY